MKILVTGAKGFTGRFFSNAATLEGHDVVPLRADLTAYSAVYDEVRFIKPDAVVHLAAIGFIGHPDSSAFYAVNTVGTSYLLEALSALPSTPNKVLLASSANIYGNCSSSPITEAQPPAPVNHYSMSKVAMEQMAMTYSDRLPIVITRPFNYTGRGQSSNFLIPKLVSHFVRKADYIDLGNVNVEREFNDVRMVCQAYLRLLENGVPGQLYNVCSGVPYKLQDVLEMLGQIKNHRLEIQINPELVRPNEVQRLCGSPDKLLLCTGSLSVPTLENTLQWMLSDPNINACK
jgi:nucleoside-diphosphate-sugar epimerase